MSRRFGPNSPSLFEEQEDTFPNLRDASSASLNIIQGPTKRTHDLSSELVERRMTLLQTKRQKTALSPISSDNQDLKKAKRDSLLQEIEQLKADLKIARAENERLRLSKTVPLSVSELSQETLPMLLRAAAVPKEPDRSEVKRSIFQNLDAFLPFNSRRSRRHRARLDEDICKKLPSHLPQSTENELTYLQAFTPLIWTSKMISLYPRSSQIGSDVEINTETESEIEIELLQKQIISATHFSGIFSARLALIFDPISQKVIELSLLYLPTCAEHELGDFIRNVKSKFGNPEQLKTNREIGVVGYAMGRWVEVSLRRARFWWLVMRRYSTSAARRNSLSLSYPHNTKKKGNKNGLENDGILFGEGEDNEADNSSNDESDEIKTGTSKLTSKDLLPHLGRSMLCINGNNSMAQKNSGAMKKDDFLMQGIEILFEWNLSFDWTGEVKSHISASSSIPESCPFSLSHFSLLFVNLYLILFYFSPSFDSTISSNIISNSNLIRNSS